MISKSSSNFLKGRNVTEIWDLLDDHFSWPAESSKDSVNYSG